MSRLGRAEQGRDVLGATLMYALALLGAVVIVAVVLALSGLIGAMLA